MPAAPTRRNMLTCRPSNLSGSAASGAGQTPYKTMARGYEARTLEAFYGFLEKGFVYRGPEAGLLVHPRPHRPGRGRGGVREPHQPVDLRALPSSTSDPAAIAPGARRHARSSPSSGPRRRGRCPRRWPWPFIPISSTWRWKPIRRPTSTSWPRQLAEQREWPRPASSGCAT